MRRSKEDTNETIRLLIETAGQVFTRKGYADAALEDIASEAQLTRGALYHHFGNKKGIFHAVLESVQKRIAERILTESAQSDDVWKQLLLGCRAFVTAAVEPQHKRILLIDGPAVFGWEVWRTMDSQNSVRLLHEQLQLLEREHILQPVSVDALTPVISGALNEAALWIAQQPDEKQALADSMTAVSLMLNGFKRNV
ncbi:MAG: transcriptional regulator, TetR family protein [Paenibacillus sp.]|jgi:AcrR family transcriptional regulator|uniref:TetR/AcrR family transcriptional regulator n=1 Tax=Paenibacillus sp. GCM10012303 TaxID=3317340 RepID=UPI0029E83CBC|nr:transcriptional regulator, TetR family protein [Paenibacillus sp.]